MTVGSVPVDSMVESPTILSADPSNNPMVSLGSWSSSLEFF